MKKSIPILFIIGNSRFISHCDNNTTSKNTELVSDCSKYNTLFQRLSWAERRNRCNSDVNCKFIGRRFTGYCESNNITKKENNEEISNIEDEIKNDLKIINTYEVKENKVDNNNDIERKTSLSSIIESTNKLNSNLKKSPSYAELIPNLSPQNKQRLPIKVYIGEQINEQITNSAVDSLRDSQQHVQEVAKSVVLEILTNPNNQSSLGLLLNDMFLYESILAHTRNLIYWSLTFDETIYNSKWQLEWQIHYWLRDNEPLGARIYTKDNIVSMSAWWLTHPESRSGTIVPFLDWYYGDKEIVDYYAQNASGSIPTVKVNILIILFIKLITYIFIIFFKDALAQEIISAAVESLKSEEVKYVNYSFEYYFQLKNFSLFFNFFDNRKYAKEAILFYLINSTSSNSSKQLIHPIDVKEKS